MPEETCGIIIPRRDNLVEYLRSTDYLPVCICNRNHFGPHVVCMPNGQLVAWEDDLDCGCCSPEEDERCYTYWEITAEEFKNYLS